MTTKSNEKPTEKKVQGLPLIKLQSTNKTGYVCWNAKHPFFFLIISIDVSQTEHNIPKMTDETAENLKATQFIQSPSETTTSKFSLEYFLRITPLKTISKIKRN